MNNSLNNYSINFDLHTDKTSEKELEKNVGIPLSRMYEIIKNHFLNNGFHWVQGSGYITNEPISAKRLNNVIKNLYSNNIWLAHFTRDIKNTIVINNTYSYNKLIKEYDEIYQNKHKL